MPTKLLLAAIILAAPIAAQAEPVADFYRGKTVNLLIGVGVGGEYDIQARLVARHIGKHIPGNPTVVPQNMTGAGGLRMTNYLYNVASKDGTYVGMIANSFPAMQAAGIAGVQFDAGKMQWIGSIAPVVETMTVWHTTGIKNIDDLRSRETVAGASARGAITYFYPQMMNELLGTDRGLLVPAVTDGAMGLATRYLFDEAGMEQAVARALAMSADEYATLGRTARAWFDANRADFPARVGAALQALQR